MNHTVSWPRCRRAGVIRSPVGDPVPLPRERVTASGVGLERHGKGPAIVGGAAPLPRPWPLDPTRALPLHQGDVGPEVNHPQSANARPGERRPRLGGAAHRRPPSAGRGHPAVHVGPEVGGAVPERALGEEVADPPARRPVNDGAAGARPAQHPLVDGTRRRTRRSGRGSSGGGPAPRTARPAGTGRPRRGAGRSARWPARRGAHPARRVRGPGAREFRLRGVGPGRRTPVMAAPPGPRRRSRRRASCRPGGPARSQVVR